MRMPPAMTEDETGDYLLLLGQRHQRLILEALVDRPDAQVPVEECLDLELDSTERYEECKQYLDTLERADLIVYNETTRAVSQGQRFDEIEPYVRAVSRAAQPHDYKQERNQLSLVNRGLEHDLLNSLNTIRGRISLLREAEEEATKHHHLDVVESGIEQMRARIETMAAFTDAVVGNESHNLRSCNLPEFLGDEISKVRNLNRDVDVTQNGVPDVAVRADDRLSLLLENLLRNAVEHNNTESPTVRVSGRCENGMAELTIEDDGPGFPDETKRNLFEDGAVGTESDGTGFGLHFVKQTLDTYGGEMTVKDRESGEGSTVVVRLPRAEDADENSPANRQTT